MPHYSGGWINITFDQDDSNYWLIRQFRRLHPADARGRPEGSQMVSMCLGQYNVKVTGPNEYVRFQACGRPRGHPGSCLFLDTLERLFDIKAARWRWRRRELRR